jgi:hypothetical protein
MGPLPRVKLTQSDGKPTFGLEGRLGAVEVRRGNVTRFVSAGKGRSLPGLRSCV